MEAEEGVLGSVLLDNGHLHDVMTFLTVDDFYRDVHQKVFLAVRDMYDLGNPADAITLAEELTRRGQFEAVGGEEFIAQLINSVPHSINALYYAKIVRQKSDARQLDVAAAEIRHDVHSNTFTAEELVERAERRIFAIADGRTKGDTHDLRESAREAFRRIAARAESSHPVTGIGTGYVDLDDLTGGFHPEQLIILAARPSMGKTALALNICDHVAVELRKPALLVSLEMAHVELAERLLCARTRVDGHKLRTGRYITYPEMNDLADGLRAMESAPLIIDDTPARNMLQIIATARRLKMRGDLTMILVDYIQLIDADNPRDSRQEQVSKISRRLKALARELKVPVVALSQLNRAVENREDHRPRLADLRESGAIEQDADIVLLLHRPEYYDPNDQPGVAELIVAKNRNGITDSVKLTWIKSCTRFETASNRIEPATVGRADF
jgi:replicative DNA helicase